MQEVLKDGSEGKAFVEDTIEELLPHIKKSLEDPNVAFVKIFKGKALVAKVATEKIEKKVRFVAEEEKKKIVDVFEEKKISASAPGEEQQWEGNHEGTVNIYLEPSEGISFLDYPISVLTEERDNIHGLPKNRVDKLNKGIEILNEVKRKDEMEKRIRDYDKREM